MIDVDLLAPEVAADPYPLFAELRRDHPVHFNERYRSWFVLRHGDVWRALRDDRFSAARITGARQRQPEGIADDALAVLEHWMVFLDPPDHTRLRDLLRRAFTPRAVEAMRPRIRTFVDGLIDDVVASGRRPVDLIDAVAAPLTATVIAAMLGVPATDRNDFQRWSDEISGLVFASFQDPGRHARAAHGMAELTGYLRARIAACVAAPGDDLLTALVHARDRGDALSEDEVVATAVLLLFAGHETTTGLIANGTLALLAHPDQLAALRDGTVPPERAVEELLRFDGPASSIARVTAAPVELDGHEIPAGARVFLVLAAANRDPDVFVDPDGLDLGRDPNPHVGFGFGIHYCLGAPLARLEGAIAIPRLLQRLPDLRLADQPLRWGTSMIGRGMAELPVHFG